MRGMTSSQDPAPRVPADRRSRAIVIAASVAALAVMAGLVLLALGGSEAPPQAGASPRVPSAPLVPEGTPMPEGCVPDPAQPPGLQVDLDEAGVDFGRVRQGQQVERRVTFRSTGTGALCIRDVQTGCGCVKARLEGDKRRFEPGESGTLVLLLDSTGRHGVQSKAFSLVTNELAQARRTWPVKADISLGVVAQAQGLDFGRPRRGAPVTASIRLASPRDEAPWKVSSVTVKGMGSEPAPACTWEAREVPDPALRVVEITVQHPGRTQQGLWRAPVVVGLDHPERREVLLDAQMLVLAPVAATPPQAIFGYVEPGASPRELPVYFRPATTPAIPFKVSEPRVVPMPGQAFDAGGAPFVASEVEVPPGGQAGWVVRVRYDGKARAPGLLEAELVVATDLPEQPEVRVPLRATVAGRR